MSYGEGKHHPIFGFLLPLIIIAIGAITWGKLRGAFFNIPLGAPQWSLIAAIACILGGLMLLYDRIKRSER